MSCLKRIHAWLERHPRTFDALTIIVIFACIAIVQTLDYADEVMR